MKFQSCEVPEFHSVYRSTRYRQGLSEDEIEYYFNDTMKLYRDIPQYTTKTPLIGEYIEMMYVVKQYQECEGQAHRDFVDRLEKYANTDIKFRKYLDHAPIQRFVQNNAYVIDVTIGTALYRHIKWVLYTYLSNNPCSSIEQTIEHWCGPVKKILIGDERNQSIVSNNLVVRAFNLYQYEVDAEENENHDFLEIVITTLNNTDRAPRSDTTTPISEIIDDTIIAHYRDVYVCFINNLKNLIYNFNQYIHKEHQYIEAIRIMLQCIKKELFEPGPVF
jgi:hypothetical protein